MSIQAVETTKDVAEKAKRNPIVVTDAAALFDTGKFEHMNRIATAMASMDLMPTHLKGKPADCLLVVEQAWNWQMSPTAVGAKTYSVGGKLGYEGQLVAAVVNTRAGLKGRLRYTYEGEGKELTITVHGTFEDEDEERTVSVRWEDGFAMSKGAKDKWQSQPEQQLSYFGARVWARRHCPEVIMGVYTPDELMAETGHYGPDHARDVTPQPPARPQKTDYQAPHPGIEAPADNELDQTNGQDDSESPSGFELFDEHGVEIGVHAGGEWLDAFWDHARKITDAAAARQYIENNADAASAVHEPPGVFTSTHDDWGKRCGQMLDKLEQPQEEEKPPQAEQASQDEQAAAAGANDDPGYPYFDPEHGLVQTYDTADGFLEHLERALKVAIDDSLPLKPYWDANTQNAIERIKAGGKSEDQQTLSRLWDAVFRSGKL